MNRRLNQSQLPCAAITLILVLAVLSARLALADTYTVGASGCDFTTIQSAINDAGTVNGDTIRVADAVHTEHGITVSKNLTIEGTGATETIVQAHANGDSATDRVLFIQSGKTVIIRDMTIRHGNTWMEGGGVYNQGAATLARCVISNNRGGDFEGRGGGVYNSGTIELQDCTISNNTCEFGEGGGFCSWNGGTLVRCTISGNYDRYFAGGVASWSGTLSLINCTISGNSSYWEAGGLGLGGGTATITNCTINANTSTSGGGTGGIDINSGAAIIANSIVAGNTGLDADVHGTFSSNGYNLIGSNSGAAASFPAGSPNDNDDWVGTSGSPVDPLLGALADNGGPTQTHALETGSPALNRIANAVNGMGTAPLDVDQRGEPRPAGGDGDIGAYEAQGAASAPTLTTASVSEITTTTATCGGDVTAAGGASVTARGVCWSTSANPTTADSKTTDGTGTGEFVSSITGLAAGTSYHTRAYATNSVGTSYGDDVGFPALPAAPVATSATGVTATSFSANWNAANSATGYRLDVATDSGFTSYVTGYQDVDVGAVTTHAVGSGLTAGTTYYYGVRAYNDSGTGTNSNTVTVSALSPAPVATAATNVVATSFSANWNAATGATGYCLDVATDSGFTGFVTGCQNIDAGNVATYAVTNLTAGTAYYYRVRAYNDSGTGVNSNATAVTTLSTPPVITAAVSEITTTTATCGGNITDDGGATVTARGVCWSTSANPTTADSKTTDGNGTGDFVSSVTGLSPGNTYHVRAYATNSVGTAYGDDVDFTASTTTPTVSTAAMSDITIATATCGGIVAATGGASVTARGVCWSTSGDPTTADDKTADGTGAGVFTSCITGLTPGTTYHVRAYATNSVGPAYGADQSFATASADDHEDAPPDGGDDRPSEKSPDLRVGITSLTAQANVAEEIAFRVDVQNVGAASASGVVLRFPLPPDTEFVSVSWVTDDTGQSMPLEAYVENGQIIIELGDVATAEELAIKLVLRAQASGRVTLTASVACAESITPATSEANADVDVEDVYWQVVNTILPVHACGRLGVAPLFVLAGLAEMKRRGAPRR